MWITAPFRIAEAFRAWGLTGRHRFQVAGGGDGWQRCGHGLAAAQLSMAGPDEFEKFSAADGVAMNASQVIGIGITTAATLLAPATVDIASTAHPSAHTRSAADCGRSRDC